jgi:hypothetical protein
VVRCLPAREPAVILIGHRAQPRAGFDPRRKCVVDRFFDGTVEPEVELVEERILLVRLSVIAPEASRRARRERFEIGENARRFVQSQNRQPLPDVAPMLLAPTDVPDELGVAAIVYFAQIVSQRGSDQRLGGSSSRRYMPFSKACRTKDEMYIGRSRKCALSVRADSGTNTSSIRSKRCLQLTRLIASPFGSGTSSGYAQRPPLVA